VPVIATNLSASIFEEINRHVQTGTYSSVEQFLEIAAFNQLALERGVTPAEIVNHGHRSAVASTSGKPIVARQVPPERSRVEPMERQPIERPASAQRPKAARSSKGRRRKRAAVHERKKTGRLDSATLAASIEQLGPVGDVRVPELAEARPRPPDEHLWGQVNRLFPMKVVCRWLVRNNDSAKAWLRADEVLAQLGNQAALLGSHLESTDEAAGRKRDELLATGLPRVANGPSRERFLSQYVARMTRTGLYPGAITQYALATFDEDQIVLTRLGLALARLSNPVLDGDLSKAAATLSDHEREFFVKQVLPLLPGELHDITIALHAVRAGNATPEELNQVVATQFHDRWTPIMVRTHISGVVSRMVEMGILRRRWEGRRVNYELGDSAAFVPTDGTGAEQR
jgi:hypothetical protein